MSTVIKCFVKGAGEYKNQYYHFTYCATAILFFSVSVERSNYYLASKPELFIQSSLEHIQNDRDRDGIELQKASVKE